MEVTRNGYVCMVSPSCHDGHHDAASMFACMLLPSHAGGNILPCHTVQPAACRTTIVAGFWSSTFEPYKQGDQLHKYTTIRSQCSGESMGNNTSAACKQVCTHARMHVCRRALPPRPTLMVGDAQQCKQVWSALQPELYSLLHSLPPQRTTAQLEALEGAAEAASKPGEMSCGGRAKWLARCLPLQQVL
jgi:hypothetical protein